MPTCFVMQPFDNAKFDRRFHDVFSPAISAANMTPYRVDQDPGVEIPIAEIERGIRTADVCFAEITTDNPNVWFELGHALALDKPVCMVCSSERKTPFPFDVRHRSIIEYTVDSSSDFEALKPKITARLSALVKRDIGVRTIESLQPSTETAGLSPHEVATLAISVASSVGENDFITFHQLKQAMERAGFTDIATGVAVRSLLRKGFVRISEVSNNWNDDTYSAVVTTEDGETWLLNNQHELALRLTQREENGPDVPF